MKSIKIAIAALVAAMIPAFGFIATGNPDCFCLTVVLFCIGLLCWIDYEMSLADKEIDMQIEEWNVKQEREKEIIMTKTAIRRELIDQWEKIS